MTRQEALLLLKESALSIGEYTPSKKFMKNDSIAIKANNQIVFATFDNEECEPWVDGLIKSECFKDSLKKCMETNEIVLEKVKFSNKSFFENIQYKCLIKSNQGVIEVGDGVGELVAVTPNYGNLAFCICVNNELMKIIMPDAKDLSI